MVLTAAETTAFFEAADQMNLPPATRAQLATEGIVEVSDLAEFNETSLKQLADNLRRPGGRIPDPNDNAVPGATIPTPPFIFGAKSQKRLLVATDLMKYYAETGRELTAANIAWTHVMQNFEIQWKALKDKKEDDPPDVPKISRTLPIMKWVEAFKDFCSQKIGSRNIPMSYLTRDDVNVPAAVPALATNQPHSAVHGSVEAELVARASHNHPLFRVDNATLYHDIATATLGTQYAPSIKPFQRTKNGIGAFRAIIGQFAGKDKWEAEIKRQELVLHTYKWKGQSNFSLEKFISQHRSAFVSLQGCTEQVPYQLPNEHSRVGFVLEAIECSDAGLQAAMASIRTDNGVGGMRSNFEAMATHLLPYDPVAKKNANKKRANDNISGVDGAASVGAAAAAKPDTKDGIGKTGVHLRWYAPSEYYELSDPQKAELYEWRKANPEKVKESRNKKQKAGKGKGKGKGKGSYYTDKQLSSLVSKQVKSALEEEEQRKETESKEDAAIWSIFERAFNSRANVSASKSASPPDGLDKEALRAIVKRSKNKDTKN